MSSSKCGSSLVVVCNCLGRHKRLCAKMTNLRAATCAISWLSVRVGDLANVVAHKYRHFSEFFYYFSAKKFLHRSKEESIVSREENFRMAQNSMDLFSPHLTTTIPESSLSYHPSWPPDASLNLPPVPSVAHVIQPVNEAWWRGLKMSQIRIRVECPTF